MLGYGTFSTFKIKWNEMQYTQKFTTHSKIRISTFNIRILMMAYDFYFDFHLLLRHWHRFNFFFGTKLFREKELFKIAFPLFFIFHVKLPYRNVLISMKMKKSHLLFNMRFKLLKCWVKLKFKSKQKWPSCQKFFFLLCFPFFLMLVHLTTMPRFGFVCGEREKTDVMKLKLGTTCANNQPERIGILNFIPANVSCRDDFFSFSNFFRLGKFHTLLRFEVWPCKNY